MSSTEPPPTGTDADRLVHWLVSSLELETSVFHVGQYCGSWQASTAHRGLASFHLVLHGQCHLHIEGHPSAELRAGDGVFLLRDIPHFLSPDPDRRVQCSPVEMQRLAAVSTPGATGLACGFFRFRNALSELLVGSFPDHLVIRRDQAELAAVRALFDLILAEARRESAEPSPLIARLTELLFFYVVRHVARRDDVSAGLWAVARRTEFVPLLSEMVREPGRDWSVQDMARRASMSRATFFKHFVETCGQPPAQFLLVLRMKIAAQRLHRGDSITHAAEHVGYRSYAAFSRAFKRVNGEQPGRYQRARRAGAAATGAPPGSADSDDRA